MAYKVGSLADLISGTHDAASSNKNIIYVPAVRKNVRPSAENLQTLYHVSPGKRHLAPEAALSSQHGGKKIQLESSEVIAEVAEGQEELPSSPQRSQFKRRRRLDKEEEARTIFIKNVPYSANSKELKRKFEKYGSIECLRFRCAPQEDPRIPKKVSVIKKEFHPERTNISAFVRFHDFRSVDEALKANGTLFEGYRIFVDKALNKKEHNQKKAIFLGNIPFGAEENDIWNIFEKCGKITDIRIVRDKATGLGKGFAFVNFESADAVELAISLHGVKLNEKELRVFRATKNPTSQQQDKVDPNKRIQRKGNWQNQKGNGPGKKNKQLKDKNIKSKFKNSEKLYNKKMRNKESVIESIKKGKKVQNQFQGQKIGDKKKKKKKMNKNELKKKIIAEKLTNSGGKGKRVTK